MMRRYSTAMAPIVLFMRVQSLFLYLYVWGHNAFCPCIAYDA